MKFDFSAFGKRPGVAERIKIGNKWAIGAGIACVGAMLILFVIMCVSRNWSGFIPIIITLAVLISPLIVQYRELGRAIQLQQFAMTNGMTYVHDAPFDYRDGVIFGEGHSQKFIDLLRSDNSNFAEIGNYRYVTGSGKNQQMHRYGFVRIKLPRKLPNMVLDSKNNNTFGRFSNLPESFGRGQKLSLEGDFDKYFTLYAPQQYKTDALYIFTPDVMQALIDTVGKYDCEVIDDDFYIYTQPQFAITSRDSFERIMQIVNTLKPELTHESNYYADENVGNRAANIVAPSGARLKTHMSVASIVIIVVVVVLFGFNTIVNFMR